MSFEFYPYPTSISTVVNEWSRDGQEMIRTFVRVVFIVTVRAKKLASKNSAETWFEEN
jgi:hypothetical protein